MALSKAQQQEVRSLADQQIGQALAKEVRPELALHSTALENLSGANADLAKAMERMSLVLFGDETLGVVGLTATTKDLEKFRSKALLERAKLLGIWIGAVTAGTVLIRVAWEILNTLFTK